MTSAGSGRRVGPTPEPFDGELYSQSTVPEAPLTVAAVAARLGVAASTLRTWDRRYGLGPSAHVAGSHRRYTPQDVSRLEHMRRLSVQGVAPADAARAALAAADLYSMELLAASADHMPPVLPAALVDPLTVAAAAIEGDAARLRRLILQVVGQYGLVRAWSEHVRPAARILTDHDRLNLPGTAPLHFLDQAVLEACRAVVRQADLPHLLETAKNKTKPSAPGRPLGVVPEGAELEAAPTPQAQVVLAAGRALVRAHVIGAELTRRGVTARVGRRGAESVEEVMGFVAEARPVALGIVGPVEGTRAIIDATAGDPDVTVYLLGRDAENIWATGVRRVSTLSASIDELVAVCEPS